MPRSTAKTELFAQWGQGSLVVADQGASTGSRFWVGSTVTGATDATGYGKSPEAPFATLDYAIGQCTDNKKDIIYLMPGHSETYSTTGTKVTLDVAGVRVVGLGQGADRPTFTFSDTGATWVWSAASVSLENVLLVTGVDSVVVMITISGADWALKNVEIRDTTNVEVIDAIITTAAADRGLVDGLLMNGYTGGNAHARTLKLVGVDVLEIKNSIFHGLAGTAFINFSGTVSTGVNIHHCVFENTGTALTKNIVDNSAGTASVWEAHDCFDLVGGYGFSGGSASALASDDVSSITTALATVDGYFDVPTANAAANTTVRDVVGNKTDDAVNAKAANKSAIAYLKGVLDEIAVPAQNNTDNAFVNDVIGQKTDGAAAGAVTTTDTLVGYVKQIVGNVRALSAEATADTSDPVDLTAEVVDNSVLAHVLTDDGDTSDYDRRYMSLEAQAKLLQIMAASQLNLVGGSAMPTAIWYVDANIASSGDGKTPATAFKTLPEAITACSSTVDDWVLVFDYSGGGAGTLTINKSFVHLIGFAPKGMPYPRIKPSDASDGITITDAADRVEIANLVIGGGDQTVAAIAFSGATGSYGCHIHDNVIGRDADAPCLLGVSIPAGVDAPYLWLENNRFYGQSGAGIAAAGSAVKIAGNMTYGNILNNYVQDVGRTATPAIWLSGTVTGPRIEGNRIKTDTDTGTGSAITLSANVSEGWISGNVASDGKDAPGNNPFVDGGSTNGWGINYTGKDATLPA